MITPGANWYLVQQAGRALTDYETTSRYGYARLFEDGGNYRGADLTSIRDSELLLVL